MPTSFALPLNVHTHNRHQRRGFDWLSVKVHNTATVTTLIWGLPYIKLTELWPFYRLPSLCSQNLCCLSVNLVHFLPLPPSVLTSCMEAPFPHFQHPSPLIAPIIPHPPIPHPSLPIHPDPAAMESIYVSAAATTDSRLWQKMMIHAHPLLLSLSLRMGLHGDQDQ